MPTIKVLVVDDSVMIRKMISGILDRDPDIEVIGVAAHGRIAIQKLSQLKPDIMTMDVEMPEMDGISAVKEIRKVYKTLPIIMYSSLTERGASSTLDALEAGATDYVTKPTKVGTTAEGLKRLEEELVPKIKALCKVRGTQKLDLHKSLPKKRVESRAKNDAFTMIAKPISLVCIGSSTGGPKALEEVITKLPGDFPLPIAIVQHMPPMFTATLAKRLDGMSEVSVYEGAEGDIMQAGTVYIAPGGRHMDLKVEGGAYHLTLHDDPPENSCRPAVDVFFRSAAQQLNAAVLGVILTGMGQDGFRGSEYIREAGGQVIAQDEETSVVWGMPGYVAEGGLANIVLPLKGITNEIIKRVKKRSL